MNHFSQVIIHHSGGPRTQTFKSIRDGHMEKGWNDIGYHYVVDGKARRHIGRRLPLKGAHAPPNSGRIGILGVGNNLNPISSWTYDQIEEIRLICTEIKSLMPWLTFHGHRTVMRKGYTECPGIDLRDIFPEFVKDY